ncbi:MAG TPA: hypothetical protein VF049_22250 [Nocardioidaceae bacterium]
MTTIPDHGTTARAFSTGCHCTPCRDAKNAYQRQTYRLRGYGQWQPYVDAGPTREHLHMLHNAGVSYQQIADQSGLSYGNLRRIVSGATKRVRPDTQGVVLALTVEGMRRKLLPSAGSARRLQALLAVGWPLVRLAPHIGVSEYGINRLIHQPYVFRDTAASVAAVYERLKDLKPEEHGVPLVGAQKSRALARRRGWPDPVWWEDYGHIDDPDFDPATVEQRLTRDEQGALRREEITHLAEFGLGRHEIAARLGLAPGYVRDLMRQLGVGEYRRAA